ncbi:Uncharacterized protein AXF42_Ash003274 [Apostasia shenzhenica]|uniref:Glutaredoxin domain-containing protein n=1 Tax=Apostasia shenzhenica TaxID=1088818 RepID=A0A2I0BFQ3_9ASPA|nr:Uncharacterized protein AXF42_Ash003274 [Apostasia shenzhenica]
MGCTSSREARRDRQRSPSAFSRSLSLPVFRCSQRKGKGFHVADLNESSDEEMMKTTNDRHNNVPQNIIVAAGGSTAAGEYCEKTPAEELGLETINVWELMEDLNDITPDVQPSVAPTVDWSFSLNTFRDAGISPPETPAQLPPPPPSSKQTSPSTSSAASPKPFWIQSPAADLIEFDLEVISNFRKAMNELSPLDPTILQSPAKSPADEIRNFAGIVKARVTAFQEKIDAKKASLKSPAAGGKIPPGGEGKLVLYSTSLRGVRKTFEDCWNVRIILQGYGNRIDERDVSMHSGFKNELFELLGAANGGSRLPAVFADGKFIGGAEEVTQMHEAGELEKAFESCRLLPAAKGYRGVDCEGCGDVRFVPCENCSGSCKVFVEEEEDDCEKEGGGFRRCPDCNENGLVRCPLCCY